MTRRVAALSLVLALAGAASSQDAPQDPAAATEVASPDLAVLRDAAERAAPGDDQTAAYKRLALACEAARSWNDGADAWRHVAQGVSTPDARVAPAEGEGRCLLGFAEDVLAAGEPGAAIRAAFEDARAALKRAAAAGSKDVGIRIGLARCLAAEGRTDAQIAELRSAAAEAPDDPAPRRALAFALYHAARHAEAIPVFRELSDAAPADLNLSLTLAGSARAVKDETLALAMAARTLESHPDDSRAWEAYWSVYGAEKRWGELADCMDRLAKGRAASSLAAHYAGYASASAQRWDAALSHLDRAWKLDPRNAGVRLEAARILLVHKLDRNGASQCVQDVLATDPTNRKAGDLLSFVAMRRSEEGDHAGAVRDLESLAARRPDDPILFANLGLEQRWSGKYTESETSYRQALAVAPDDAQLHNDLGLLLLAIGRDTEARAQFELGIRADANANDGLENLGWMARRDGKLSEAVAWYRKAYQAALRRGNDGARHRRNLDDNRFPLPPIFPDRR
ncbi:MAG: tetratricopeptide repeat protein [Planctomycetes bacterium]|nr:tetratricopeptide repeat protein [Planctomycetota bacterium]